MVKSLHVPWIRPTPSRLRERPAHGFGYHPLAAFLGLILVPALALAEPPAPAPSAGQASTQAQPAAAPAEAASPAPTPEQEQAAREEAAQRFQRGLGFYGDGDYALALIEFDRAYLLVPDYRVLYNIGQVSIQLARFARARVALEQYLAEGGAAIPPERVLEVERDLRMLSDRTAELEVKCTQDGVEVFVDDHSHGETPLAKPLLLDAGEHQVIFKKEGFQTLTRRIVLAGAERLPLTIDLLPIEPVVVVQKPDPVKVDQPPPVEPERRGPHPAVYTWIATGVLAGAAVTTGVLGLDAKARHDELLLLPDMGEETAAAASEANALFVACDVLWISAAAALGTSLYLTLHKAEPKAGTAASSGRASSGRASSGRASSGSAELVLLPHSVRLRGTF